MTTEFDRLGFVRSVCRDPEVYGDGYLSEPFRAGEWTVATDGHAMVAWPREAEDPEGRAPSNTAPYVLSYIANLPPLAFEATVQALREWAGSPKGAPCPDCTPETRQTASRCAECKGKKEGRCICPDCEHEHVARCEACDGHGVEPCRTCEGEGEDHRPRYGFLGSSIVNRAVLAKLLRLAPEGTVGVHVPEHPELAVHLTGDPWRGLVMPVRQESEIVEAARANTFPLEQPTP